MNNTGPSIDLCLTPVWMGSFEDSSPRQATRPSILVCRFLSAVRLFGGTPKWESPSQSSPVNRVECFAEMYEDGIH